MNQKDYKAISGVISIRSRKIGFNFNIVKECYESVFSSQKYEDSILHTTFGKVIGKIMDKVQKEIAIKLADYFEKEDMNQAIDKETDLLMKNKKVDRNKLIKFNRKQFLKDCGVK